MHSLGASGTAHVRAVITPFHLQNLFHFPRLKLLVVKHQVSIPSRPPAPTPILPHDSVSENPTTQSITWKLEPHRICPFGDRLISLGITSRFLHAVAGGVRCCFLFLQEVNTIPSNPHVLGTPFHRVHTTCSLFSRPLTDPWVALPSWVW